MTAPGISRAVHDALRALTPGDRCMMSTPSSGAVADVVRLGWASGAALALIKPEVSDTDCAGGAQPT